MKNYVRSRVLCEGNVIDPVVAQVLISYFTFPRLTFPSQDISLT